MRKVCITILLVIVFLFGQRAYCQQRNRDTLVVHFAEKLRQQLNLSDTVTAEMISLGHIESIQLDSLNHLNLSSEERKADLLHIISLYKQNVENILSSVQWQQYQQITGTMESRFMEYAKDNKIKVKKLDDNSQ